MIAAKDMPKRWVYANVQGQIHSWPQKPICSFCGEPSVFYADVQNPKGWWTGKLQMYACVVCKEQLKEVSVKSFLPPPTWAPGVDELWYQMSKEQVYKHPLYLKWQGC